jgi:hypothetical protein
LIIFEEFIENMGKQWNWEKMNRPNFIKEHISGWDIQESAINITKSEIEKWCRGEIPKFYRNGSAPIDSMDIISNEFKNRFLIRNTLFYDGSNQYNLIIANPPYGNLLTSEEKQQLKGKYNCRLAEVVELFLEKGLQLLKANSKAFLCYIVPKTICYYQQWAKIRKQLLKYEIKEIIDLGIAFLDVNLEQIAIIINGQLKENRNPRESPIYLSKAEPLKKVEKQIIQRVGQIPNSLIKKNQLIIFAPLTDQELKLLQDIDMNSNWLPQLGRNYPLIPFSTVMKRSIYISIENKTRLQPGDTYFINKVPDISEKGIEKIYKITSPQEISEYLHPKLMFKVFRGSRMVTYADPIGNIVTTEKIVNFFLDPKYYAHIWGIQAILNTRPPSFYLQAVVFSQTTESSRVMDPFYAKFIPIPKIPTPEWEEITKWSKLSVLANHEHDLKLVSFIKEFIEIKAIIYYFPSEVADIRRKIEENISENQSLLFQLFNLAQISRFEEFYPKLLASKKVELPIDKKNAIYTDRIQIWDNDQKIEINKLTELLENSLDLSNLKSNLKMNAIYTQLYHFLGK